MPVFLIQLIISYNPKILCHNRRTVMPITSIEKFGIIERDKSYQDLNSMPSPSWAKSAIMYEVYLRSFSKDGTMKSLMKKLPDLKDFGIDILWLMPIHLIGHLKRKGPLGSPYAIRDFYRINPEFGNKDDFLELVNACHELDMRIVMDFVANHAANDHIEVKNHPDWFKQDDKGNFSREVPGWSDVIDFNYENQELRKYIMDVALYWAKEFKIDGYRCDVAGMVPEDFWVELRAELQKINPEFLMIAEWEDPEMHLSSFDVTYDWVLYYKLYEVYNESATVADVADLITRRNQEFPQDALRLRFLENHDQARATYKFGAKSYRPYAAIIFALDGIPLLYNGQETGDPKHLTLFDKNPINWKVKGANETRKFYNSLITLRKENEVLTAGDTEILENDQPDHILSFSRTLDNKKAVVVLNLKDFDIAVSLNLEAVKNKNWNAFDIQTLSTEQAQPNKWDLVMAPFGGKIFISE
ncbi:alpha-amylase [candidate division KSB1 bacterium]|nr:alpha-amylase [candidate division KSB1 bacterium]